MERLPRGTIELALAALVLFSAMIDPKISVSVAVFAFIGLSIFRWRAEEGARPDAEVSALREEKADGNMAKILYLAKEQGAVTVAEVSEKLGISEEEAFRSLEDLQSQGALEQVGSATNAPLYRPK